MVTLYSYEVRFPFQYYREYAPCWTSIHLLFWCLKCSLMWLCFVKVYVSFDFIYLFKFQAARRYCPHHVGHYLGMDVHDTPELSRSQPLQPGMAITIEPGLKSTQLHVHVNALSCYHYGSRCVLLQGYTSVKTTTKCRSTSEAWVSGLRMTW